jgi:coenzyme PQQ synthesis protein D (PqqD)
MKLAKYAKFRQEKFGGVLFETRSEKVYALNATGAAIVREIGAGCDVLALVDRMNDRFRDSAGSIEREVLAFTANLRQQGLIEE